MQEGALPEVEDIDTCSKGEVQQEVQQVELASLLPTASDEEKKHVSKHFQAHDADDSKDLMWYIDCAFGVHSDYRSHTGGGLTMGKGFAVTVSKAHRLNVQSSTEGEIVSVDDCLSLVLWSREFMIAQGYGCNRNIILQDNKSSVLMEINGKASSGKRTRHMNIRFFNITDRVEKGEAEIMWVPREDMVADYLTKALQGAEFRCFRDLIMGST